MIVFKSLMPGKITRHFSLAAFLLCFCSHGVSARTLIFQAEPESRIASHPQSDVAASSSKVSSEEVINVVVPTAPASTVNNELLFMIEQLQEEVLQLRGIAEEQANELRMLKKSAKGRYLDLDQRVLSLTKQLASKAGSNPVVGGSVAIAPSRGQGAPEIESPTQVRPVGSQVDKKVPAASEEERTAYNDAYALVREKKFDQAVKRFYAFIDKYPEGALAGNAYYWLGEVYLVLPQLEQAEQAFSIVVKAYPDHPKVADALYKLGVTLDRMQKPAKSEIYLLDVQKRFPNSTAAKLAKSYKINR